MKNPSVSSGDLPSFAFADVVKLCLAATRSAERAGAAALKFIANAPGDPADDLVARGNALVEQLSAKDPEFMRGADAVREEYLSVHPSSGPKTVVPPSTHPVTVDSDPEEDFKLLHITPPTPKNLGGKDFLSNQVQRFLDDNPSISLAEKMNTPTMARAFAARLLVYNFVMEPSNFTDALPNFLMRTSSMQLFEAAAPQILSAQLEKLKGWFDSAVLEDQESAKRIFKGGSPSEANKVVEFLLHQADIVATGIMDNDEFSDYLELVRRQYQIKDSGVLSSSEVLLGKSQRDMAVRNGKAYLRTLLHWQREHNPNEDLYKTMATPENARELFARLTIHDLGMKTPEAHSRAVFECLSFVTADIPGTTLTFATQVRELKKLYDSLASQEERDAVASTFLGNVSLHPMPTTSSLRGVYQSAVVLQYSLMKDNPSFEASVEALREESLALAACP